MVGALLSWVGLLIGVLVGWGLLGWARRGEAAGSSGASGCARPNRHHMIRTHNPADCATCSRWATCTSIPRPPVNTHPSTHSTTTCKYILSLSHWGEPTDLKRLFPEARQLPRAALQHLLLLGVLGAQPALLPPRLLQLQCTKQCGSSLAFLGQPGFPGRSQDGSSVVFPRHLQDMHGALCAAHVAWATIWAPYFSHCMGGAHWSCLHTQRCQDSRGRGNKVAKRAARAPHSMLSMGHGTAPGCTCASTAAFCSALVSSAAAQASISSVMLCEKQVRGSGLGFWSGNCADKRAVAGRGR